MQSQTVRAVERAADVMEAIRVAGGTSGVTEISQELGLSKSTVHRMLVALTNKGLVRKETDSERYTFGYKVLEMAFTASRQWDVISFAMPYLEELRDDSGETAALALKVGLRYTYVTQVVSPHEYRVNPVLGHHYPLHWAATGKVILAHVQDHELQQCLESVPLLLSTPNTVSDPAALLDQLEEIRHRGYAVSFGERNPGSSAIASVILDRNGYAHAAACLIGPESRVRQMDLHALGLRVVETGRVISVACQTLGFGC